MQITKSIQSALIKSLDNIFRQMLNSSIEGITINKQQLTALPDDVYVSIDIKFTSDELSFDSPFILTFPTDTYLKIASELFMEEYTEINEEIEDVGLELANVVLGRAKQLVNEQFNGKFEMTLPTLLKSNELPDYLKDADCHVCDITSGIGKCRLIISQSE